MSLLRAPSIVMRPTCLARASNHARQLSALRLSPFHRSKRQLQSSSFFSTTSTASSSQNNSSKSPPYLKHFAVAGTVGLCGAAIYSNMDDQSSSKCEPGPLPASQATISKLMLPDDANPAGNVHGGTILSMIDEVHLTHTPHTLHIHTYTLTHASASRQDGQQQQST